MKVWLALEPTTDRITMQDRPFERPDFPRGIRGEGWEIRSATVSEETFRATLAGTLSDVETNEFHVSAWMAATREESPIA